MTIHNVPEGMAVGLAFAAGGPEVGVPTALAIGLQNVPEGFAAAAPLLVVGTTRRRAVGFAAATGAVERGRAARVSGARRPAPPGTVPPTARAARRRR